MIKNILEYYREIAKKAIDLNTSDSYGITLLKTDCHNEAYGEFPIVPWIYENSGKFKHDPFCFIIDYDEKVIENALKKFPNLQIDKGDIRNIIFDDESFGVVLDLSTIDHSPEFTVVLDEYYRILENNGICCIVVWLDDEFRHTPSSVDTGQFYFAKKDFEDEFERRFFLIEKEPMPWAVGGIGGCLTKFIGRKVA